MTVKIEELNKTTLKELRYALEETLKNIQTKYGIHVDVGNCQYSETHATFKIELAVIKPGGVVHTKIVEEFLFAAERLGLKKEDLNREFSYQNETYKLIGYSRNSRSYPFIVKRIRDGAKSKLTRDVILNCFKT